ncbi:MAG: hypothetical protein GX129_12815 [Clostridiales bacterium]|jgi:hypothetical protein|nr:hypothetical protein [Clostridiales bacterium]
MPIRPIDVMKSQEVSQYKHIQSQKTQHEQVQISKSFHNLIESEANKPLQTTKSDNKEFRYDAKEESKNSYKGRGGKGKGDRENQNKDDESDNNTGRPGGIDILV